MSYKEVISALCTLIKSICDIHIKPEHFRLAKYNTTENNVVSTFWNILKKFNSFNESENVIQNVKLYFASLNYKSVEFYCLPENMSYGSRDLLLAFSWLLAHNDILEDRLKQILYKTKIKEEFESSVAIDNVKELPTEFELSTVEDYQNYILWAVSQINQNIKIITEYSNKTADIVEKIHKEKICTSTTEHLTAGEILLTKNKEKLNNYIDEIKYVYALLDNFTKWENMEKYFWSWMKTVVDENCKNTKKKIDLSIGESFLKYVKVYVKQNLKSPEENEVHSENISLVFPRSILVSENGNDTSKNQIHLEQKDEFISKKISLENNNNIDLICEFLNKFLKT